jgi:hypothetical protein
VELYVVGKDVGGLLCSGLCYRALFFGAVDGLKKKSSACRYCIGRGAA